MVIEVNARALHSRQGGERLGDETSDCSVAVVSSFVAMSSHLITNRVRFYFFQSKCVVIVSSACHFPTRGGMQSKSVKRSLRFPRSKFENFMGYP